MPEIRCNSRSARVRLVEAALIGTAVLRARAAALDRLGCGRLVRVGVGLFGFVLLVLAVRREPAWVCAILGFAWMGFVLDISNYYYCGMALFGLLGRSAPPLTVPHAAFGIVWSGLGLVFHDDEPAMYAVASVALLAFSTSVLGWFAFRAASGPEGASPGLEHAASTPG